MLSTCLVSIRPCLGSVPSTKGETKQACTSETQVVLPTPKALSGQGSVVAWDGPQWNTEIQRDQLTTSIPVTPQNRAGETSRRRNRSKGEAFDPWKLLVVTGGGEQTSGFVSAGVGANYANNSAPTCPYMPL